MEGHLKPSPLESFCVNDKKFQIRNGFVTNSENKVAILTSPKFGAGFSSWNNINLCYNTIPVRATLEERNLTPEEIQTLGDPFLGGWEEGICVHWVEPNTVVTIVENDGSEGILCNSFNENYNYDLTNTILIKLEP